MQEQSSPHVGKPESLPQRVGNMAHSYNRHNFLRQSLAVCAGIALSGMNLSCCVSVWKRKILPKDATTESAMGQFDALGYCCFECEEKCKVLAATKNDDLEAKAEIAKKWLEMFGDVVEPKDVSCHGCRMDTPALAYGYKANCEVRSCAMDRQVASCAHCEDLSICDQSLWNEWPNLRKQAEDLRKGLTG